MANSQAMCNSFKQELLQGLHQFGPAAGTITIVSRTSLTAPVNDTFKAALYLTSATVNAQTTAYSATGEVTGTNYTAGGNPTGGWASVAIGTQTATTGTAYTTPSANITFSTVTLATAFDSCLIYNSTQSNRAVSVHYFGAQTVSAGNFTLTMPTNAAGTALINIS